MDQVHKRVHAFNIAISENTIRTKSPPKNAENTVLELLSVATNGFDSVLVGAGEAVESGLPLSGTSRADGVHDHPPPTGADMGARPSELSAAVK